MATPEPPIPEPAPVSVQNVAPIPVEVQNDEPLRVRTEQDKVAATRVSTTEKVLAGAKVDADIVHEAARVNADKLRTDDQRRISGIWERTQQIIALSVVEAALFVVSILVLTPAMASLAGRGADNSTVTASVAGMLFLTGVANLVIGFYFGRTNHQRVGGDSTSRDDAIGR